MRPINALYPLSVWLMRAGLLLFTYTQYFKLFIKFNLGNIQFYIAAIFLISAVTIFISGFLNKEKLTPASSLAILLISIYKIVNNFNTNLNFTLAIYTIIASLALFFLSKSTNK